MTMADNWSIVLKPFDSTKTIPCVQFTVSEGQKITVSWKTESLSTTRYIMRSLTAALDNDGQYHTYTPSNMGISGTNTYTVTTAGNICFAGYQTGLNATTNLQGDYVKVKIENPE